MKSFIALVTLSALSATPAMAGPYVNAEVNSGWAGSDWAGSATDLHVGYEGTAGAVSYYLQGGPQVQASNGGGDNNTELSGKVGGSIAASEDVSVYGELAFATTDTDNNNYGTKLGVKWSF